MEDPAAPAGCHHIDDPTRVGKFPLVDGLKNRLELTGGIGSHFLINEVRLDRFITLNVVRPLRSVVPSLKSSGSSLPILMYHSISDRDESGVRDYFKVCTSPERFRLQMKTLKENGWTGVDLESALARLNEDPTNKARLVAITFDDGFYDFYTEAMPVLKEHGSGATMYLPTDFIQDERRSFKGIDCMTWSEVRKCQPMGIRFGSHTRSHPKLYDLPWPEIELELQNSREELENQLGQPALGFAYPYAYPEADRAFCGRFLEVLTGTGYRSCVTTIAGRVAREDDAYSLRRLPMNGTDDANLLLAKLDGAYDWMEPAQRTFKAFKQLLPGRSRSVKLSLPKAGTPDSAGRQ